MPEETVKEALAVVPPFISMVPAEHRVTNDTLSTLQINVGYKCNLACKHCHLQCGPARTEEMSRETMQACLDAFEVGGFTSVDITGGAPEMNPDLEWFLREWQARGVRPIVRTNLCILTLPEYSHFVQVYADVDAHLFASLPYYTARNVDKIRGDGTFAASIEAMHMLNAIGYGDHDGAGDTHSITLVFNPSGATLPPSQVSLEAEFHRSLASDFNVHFSNLVAMTNYPAGRFASALARKGNLSKYMHRLFDAFNPDTTESMMCRDQISIDWAGDIYDCDFNQALGLKVARPMTIFDFAREKQPVRRIVFANHCYTCTAGAGSS